jgi:hypothetical protein
VIATLPGVSIRRVSRVLKFSRARLRARAVIAKIAPQLDEVLAGRIQHLIELHPTFGYRELWTLLRFGEGLRVNRKRYIAYLKSKVGFASFSEARTSITHWIEWYNVERPHQTLGYRSPRQFRALQLQLVAEIGGALHDYNHCRPHSSLGALTPAAFAQLQRPQKPYRPRRAN